MHDIVLHQLLPISPECQSQQLAAAALHLQGLLPMHAQQTDPQDSACTHAYALSCVQVHRMHPKLVASTCTPHEAVAVPRHIPSTRPAPRYPLCRSCCCYCAPAPTPLPPCRSLPAVLLRTAPAPLRMLLLLLPDGCADENRSLWHSGHAVLARTSPATMLCLHTLQRTVGTSRMMRPVATHTCTAWQAPVSRASQLVLQRLSLPLAASACCCVQ